MIPEKQSTYVKAYMNPDTGKMEYKSIGDAIKAADANRVSGYLVRFTDASDPDLHGEYFTKDTNFWLKEHSPIGKPIMLDHAFDAKFKSVPVGIIDFAKEDEIGIWIEGKLKERAEYEDMLRGWKERKWIDLDDSVIAQAALGIEKAVKTFFSTGKAQWSSGALPQSVEVADDGHIQSWAFIEGTGVMTPAEPDGTEIKIKRAFQELDKILTSVSTATATKEANQESKESDADNANQNNDKQDNENEDNMQAAKSMDAVREFFRMVLDEMDARMAPPEEEVQRMEDELVEEAARMDDEEKTKAEGDNEEEEVDGKSIDYARLATFVQKQLTEYREREAADKRARDEAIKKFKANLPVHDDDVLPATQKANPNTTQKRGSRITVEEMRAYSSLSGDEMALGIKLALNRVPEWERQNLKLKDFVERGVLSESYVKTMAHKAAAAIETWTPTNDITSQNDYAAVKSINFLKADELHATDITNQGAEWVELLYDTQLWRRVREDTELFNIMVNKGMRVKDVPTGVKGMNVKLETGSGTVYTLQEGNSVDATGRPEVVANLSQITTDEVEQDLATHIIAQGFTFQMQERSIIDVVSYLNEDMQRELAEAIEDVFVNGDTVTTANTNINLVDGTPATGMQTPLYIAFDGIRKNALSASTYYIDNANAALQAIDYERVRALYPLRFRRKKQNIFFLVDEQVETQTRRLAEAFTVGVAGETNATFFTGDLSVLVGYDVYASGFLNLSNGDGKISATPGNNTQGQIYAVFAPYWQYGRQLNIKIEEARYPLSQSSVFVATVNHLLKERSGYASVGMFDIAP